MNCILREATPTDVEGLDRVMRVISDGPGDQKKMAEQIEKMLSEDQKYLLVAENSESGEIVGSLLGVVFEDICGDCRPILLVENVAVLESCQGLGIGRQMFQEIERWGRERHCHYEMLVSGLNRTGAHKFYQALDFQEVKGFKKYL
ncbi:GNAT family N-acetyltransferase [Acutalibacter sp. 1XD8-33]|uniref:GNAT family N-acetyltransferase n=1 Tax=Acutalibacter sp. 1XD8-33 TaxID=2320081 RepID=UPI0013148E30|nr:GNAT family N-acetyltransferase [Acutalibacter sp. 1XD8-33]